MPSDGTNIIDNREVVFEDKFKEFCNGVDSLKIAVGYFYVSGFDRVKNELRPIKDIRIIMGDETDDVTAKQIEKGYEKVRNSISTELNTINDDDVDKIRSLKELCDFIERDRMQVRIYDSKKFHSKAYIFTSKETPRFNTAIIGSSNFSKNGMTKQGNIELNSIHRSEPELGILEKWYDDIWNESNDFKSGMLKILKTSQPYIRRILNDLDYLSPFELFKVMLFEFLNESVDSHDNVLAEYQQIGYINAQKKLEDFDGCMISDSVGLGKTYIGLRMMEHAQRQGKNILLIVPKSVKQNWLDEISKSGPHGRNFQISEGRSRLKIMTITELSNRDLQKTQDRNLLDDIKRNYDFVVIDEAHRFRNKGEFVDGRYPGNKNYANLKYLKTLGKKYVLLTATPLNNSISDLHNLLSIFVNPNKLKNYNSSLDFNHFDDYRKAQSKIKNEQGKDDPDKCLIAELKHKRESHLRGIVEILEETMILRTRTEISKKYPGLKIGGKSVKFVLPKVVPEIYNTPETYDPIYENVAYLLDVLTVPHISQINENSGYKLSGLYKILLYKRLESGIYSFVRSLERLREKETCLIDDIKKYGWDKARRSKQTQDELEDMLNNDAELADLVGSKGVDMDETRHSDEEITQLINDDLVQINNFLVTHVEKIRRSEYQYDDPKLEKLKRIIATKTDRKILIFSQYVDTVQYLYENLKDVLQQRGLNMDCVIGSDASEPIGSSIGTDTKIKLFAPIANNHTLSAGEGQIDVLISSDSLSEGVNLQDCSVIVNYDLPWNPMRIIQRVGRVDRIGNLEPTTVFNILPEEKLDVFLDLLDKLAKKIQDISAIVGKENHIVSDDEDINTRTIGVKIKELKKADSFETYETLGNNELLSKLEDRSDDALLTLKYRLMIKDLGLTELDFKAHGKPVYTAIENEGRNNLFAMYRVYDTKQKQKIKNVTLLFDYKTEKFSKINLDTLDLNNIPSGIPKSEATQRQDVDSLLNKMNDHFKSEYLEKIREKFAKTKMVSAADTPKIQLKLITRLEFLARHRALGNVAYDRNEVTRLAEEFKEINLTESSINVFVTEYMNSSKNNVGEKINGMDPVEFVSILAEFLEKHVRTNPDYSTLREPDDIKYVLVCWGVFV